jgi:hypothetical protein
MGCGRKCAAEAGTIRRRFSARLNAVPSRSWWIVQCQVASAERLLGLKPACIGELYAALKAPLFHGGACIGVGAESKSRSKPGSRSKSKASDRSVRPTRSRSKSKAAGRSARSTRAKSKSRSKSMATDRACPFGRLKANSELAEGSLRPTQAYPQ